MKGVGEPCAGEPHARFDGRGLETERFGVTAPTPDPTNLNRVVQPLFSATAGAIKQMHSTTLPKLNTRVRIPSSAHETPIQEHMHLPRLLEYVAAQHMSWSSVRSTQRGPYQLASLRLSIRRLLSHTALPTVTTGNCVRPAS